MQGHAQLRVEVVQLSLCRLHQLRVPGYFHLALRLTGDDTTMRLRLPLSVVTGTLECFGDGSRRFLRVLQANNPSVHLHLQLHLRCPSMFQPRPHPVQHFGGARLLPPALIPQPGKLRALLCILRTQRPALRRLPRRIRLVALNQRAEPLDLLLMRGPLGARMCKRSSLLLLPSSRLLSLTQEFLGAPAVLLRHLLVLSGRSMHRCQLLSRLLQLGEMGVGPLSCVSKLLS
mmetsp:Transcript_69977/g.186502  ORF Transcript_69977/g.186502 Transcript_69977/m.186502 type:complete len:231 (-) Transcript_69977:1084-1776(-)